MRDMVLLRRLYDEGLRCGGLGYLERVAGIISPRFMISGLA
jgi:hypothetical protein